MFERILVVCSTAQTMGNIQPMADNKSIGQKQSHHCMLYHNKNKSYPSKETPRTSIIYHERKGQLNTSTIIILSKTAKRHRFPRSARKQNRYIPRMRHEEDLIISIIRFVSNILPKKKKRREKRGINNNIRTEDTVPIKDGVFRHGGKVNTWSIDNQVTDVELKRYQASHRCRYAKPRSWEDQKPGTQRAWPCGRTLPFRLGFRKHRRGS